MEVVVLMLHFVQPWFLIITFMLQLCSWKLPGCTQDYLTESGCVSMSVLVLLYVFVLVCVCLCMCLCLFMCLFVCMYELVYEFVYVSMNVCSRVCVSIIMCACGCALTYCDSLLNPWISQEV